MLQATRIAVDPATWCSKSSYPSNQAGSPNAIGSHAGDWSLRTDRGHRSRRHRTSLSLDHRCPHRVPAGSCSRFCRSH